jgi:acetyl esterase/lipase
MSQTAFAAGFILALAFAVSPARAAEAPAPRPPDTTIVYARVDTLELKLDLHRHVLVPRPGFLRSLFLDSAARDSLHKASSPQPLILWFHGGGWRGGSRMDPSPALAFFDSGYAVANVSYRLSTQAQWPAQLHDAKAAVRWLRVHADSLGLDTARFVAWGTSAGGHLAAMLGLTTGADSLDGTVGDYPGVSAAVRAVVSYHGATNFLEPHPQRWKRGSSVGQLLGCAVADCRERARLASPVTHATPGDAPFFIVHGTADSTVPFRQSVALDSVLRLAGVPVELVTLPGAGHGGPGFVSAEMRARISAFLDRSFRGGAFTVAPREDRPLVAPDSTGAAPPRPATPPADRDPSR